MVFVSFVLEGVMLQKIYDIALAVVLLILIHDFNSEGKFIIF